MTVPATAPDSRSAGGGLLGKLLAAVRPEFRVEVYLPAPDDPVLGRPACAVPGCDRSGWEYGLCGGHSNRWRSQAARSWRVFSPTRARRCRAGSS